MVLTLAEYLHSLSGQIKLIAILNIPKNKNAFRWKIEIYNTKLKTIETEKNYNTKFLRHTTFVSLLSKIIIIKVMILPLV